MGECLAQALAGFGAGSFGPQQSGQSIPPVRAVRFDDEVGQQGASLVRAKVGHRPVVQRHLKGT
jgi:hypothetical protein